MARWRERAFREVRDELDRFLNYPLNQQIELGDFGIFDGKRCRFEWQGNLRDLKADCTSAGFQNEIAETYATAGVVSIQARLALGGTRPSADINFRRGAALAFRGHRIGFDQVQLIGVAKNLSAAIRWRSRMGSKTCHRHSDLESRGLHPFGFGRQGCVRAD
jgi:hypothetical protein